MPPASAQCPGNGALLQKMSERNIKMKKREVPETVQCSRCGGNFESVRETARYCPQCRIAASRKSAKERGLNRMGNAAYSRQCRQRRNGEAGKE